MARSRFAQMRVTIDDAMVGGNVVVVKARWRGLELSGTDTLGETVEFGGIVVWELDADGRICRRTPFYDVTSTVTSRQEVTR